MASAPAKKHKNLNLRLGQISLCTNYGNLRGICPLVNKCQYLHICRAWLAGHCAAEQHCQYSHSLLNDEHNFKVLCKRLGGENNLSACDNDMRRNLRKCFLLLCTPYIFTKKGFCFQMKKTNQCSFLHLCPRLVSTGVCQDKKCQLNHVWRDGYVAKQLARINVKVGKDKDKNVPPSKFIFCNVIAPDYLPKGGKRYNCDCYNKSEYKPLQVESRFGSMETLLSLDDLDILDDSDESSSSEEAAVVEEVSVQVKKKRNRKNKKKVQEEMTKPSVPAAVPKELKIEPNFAEVREFIYRNGGRVKYNELEKKFNLPRKFNLIEWRDAVDDQLEPEKSHINIFSNKNNRPETLDVYSTLRICTFYNDVGKCNRENCQYFHICRFFVADEQGNRHPKSCPQNLAHDFQDANMRRFLGRKGLEHGFKSAELCSLLVAAHPRVCAEYNMPQGCEGNCQRLHICNTVFLGPCTPACPRDLHDVAELTKPGTHNYKVLFIYAMERMAPRTLRSLVLPAAVPHTPVDTQKQGNLSKSAGKQKQKQQQQQPQQQEEEEEEAKQEPPQQTAVKEKKAKKKVEGKLELCEGYVRGVCAQMEDKCRRIHAPQPFLWQYQANDKWLPFSSRECHSLEHTFSNPSVTQWSAVIDPADQYPFSGRLEVHFALQQLLVRGKPAHSVRCLRTPSHVTLPAHCTAATRWCWYLLEPRSGRWLNADMCGPELILEAELALHRGEKKFSVDGLTPHQRNYLPHQLQTFSLDLESMELSVEGGEVMELCRRPAPRAPPGPPGPPVTPFQGVPLSPQPLMGAPLYQMGAPPLPGARSPHIYPGARPKSHPSQEDCVLQ